MAGQTQPDRSFDAGLTLACAFPERIAKARTEGGTFLLASGRGAFLETTDQLAREPWLAVADLAGGGGRDRIRLAARVDETALRDRFAGRLINESLVRWSPAGEAKSVAQTRLGAIVLDERVTGKADLAQVARHLLQTVRDDGLGLLPWGERSLALRARARFIGLEELADSALLTRLDQWLGPLVANGKALATIRDEVLDQALRNFLTWEDRRRLDQEAPERWTTPTGASVAVHYDQEGGARAEVRVQALFGLKHHPTVGADKPLILALLSPAQRPIQVTRDLPGFWAGSWIEVRKAMRGRYPKHAWPEDPANATPTQWAKPRGT